MRPRRSARYAVVTQRRSATLRTAMRNPRSAALLFAAVAAAPSFAQQPVFSRADPFLGARYGMSYDMSARAAAQSGRPCVAFDADKTTRGSDGDNKNQKETVMRSLELVKTMNLSADAQLKSLTGTFEARSTLEVANKSEVHQFSETKFFYSYRLNDSVMLQTEHISVLPENAGLLKKGVTGLDEFRAKCGNAFVIGQQLGEYYYATAFKSSETRSRNLSTNLSFSFSYRGTFNADALVKYASALRELQKTETLKVATSTSNLQLPAASNADEAEKQWTEFRPTGSSGKMVNVVVAPYTVASGALPEGVLSGNPDDAKLEVMLAALWDLKALKEAANFVLRRSEEFALGLPTGAKRTERLRDVSRLLGQWSGEFDQLLAQTKKCMQSFTEECRRTAAQYESNPRIVQAALLPAKYRNACYHSIEVTQSGDSARDGQFKLFPTGRGDTEMGGGPVVVNATLQIIQDGPSTLRARVAVTAQEDKDDRSTFAGKNEVEIFTLRPQVALQDNPLEECQLANPPVLNPALGSAPTYGIAKGRSGRDDHSSIPFHGVPNSLLRQIDCVVDTGSDDRNDLKCSTPQLGVLRVALVNKLDVEAEKWKPPADLKGLPHDLKVIGPLKDVQKK